MKFSNGFTLVSKMAGNGTHESASTGIAYERGKHFWLVKIIRAANNYTMIGVSETLAPYQPYPGANPFATGKSLYGHNGHCYENDMNSDYGIGTFQQGCYVGLLLDMDNKAVKFSINGIEGKEKTLTGNSYHFIVNIHTSYDAVEIIQEHCWHT